MRDAWHIERLNWLEELTTQELEKLRAASTVLDFEAGETIFAPTPRPSSVYLLESGLVRIYRLSSDGAETTFGFVSPGEVFGELVAVGDYPRESFAQAVQASRALRVPRDQFQEAIVARPTLVFALTRQVGDRFKRIESRVENLVFRPVRARLAHILLELAEDFGRPIDGGVLLEIQLTQAELATLVGSTRQSVNESLQELGDAQLVSREGRQLLLLQPSALRAVAGADPP